MQHTRIDRWRHPACLEDDELLKQCVVGRGRSSGPGGQHRNKVETLVILTHRPTGLQAHAGERRSQIENKGVAVRRLRLVLATERRAEVPAGEVGSVLWRSRLDRERRLACNPDHHDFPSLLAEAMDLVGAAAWDHKTAALRLECTPSQLLKLIRDHPPALLRLNKERQERGLHLLK